MKTYSADSKYLTFAWRSRDGNPGAFRSGRAVDGDSAPCRAVGERAAATIVPPRDGPTIRKGDREAARRGPHHGEHAAPIQFSPRFPSDATISNASKGLLVGDVRRFEADPGERRQWGSIMIEIQPAPIF